jgi:hypothetical protein
MDVAIIEDRIAVAERRFRGACEQIVHLNNRLSGLERRYAKSKREQQRTFRYSLRFRIAVVDGLRDVYYEFAHKQAKESAILRSLLEKIRDQ